MGWLEPILSIGVTGAMEILLLWVAFYYTIRFFRGTRGAQVLSGFVALVVLLLIVTRLLHLDVLGWLLQRFSVYLAIAFLIIFQPEIRRALAELGKQNMFGAGASDRETIEAIVEAAALLSERRIGALIAVERQIGTRATIETGKPLDALVTSDLLSTIFHPRTPLHDGGVIVRHNRIAAAGCLFPLSQQPELSRAMGTRHRAAVGLTEECDGIVVVVSEETGAISVAYNGRLSRGLDEDRLRRTLLSVLLRVRPEPRGRLARMRKWLHIPGLNGAAAAPVESSAQETDHAAQP